MDPERGGAAAHEPRQPLRAAPSCWSWLRRLGDKFNRLLAQDRFLDKDTHEKDRAPGQDGHEDGTVQDRLLEKAWLTGQDRFMVYNRLLVQNRHEDGIAQDRLLEKARLMGRDRLLGQDRLTV
jgi:hypothetical protein